MIEKSDRKELERRLEQAKRAAALFNDPVTTERLQKLVKIWKNSFGCRSRSTLIIGPRGRCALSMRDLQAQDVGRFAYAFRPRFNAACPRSPAADIPNGQIA